MGFICTEHPQKKQEHTRVCTVVLGGKCGLCGRRLSDIPLGERNTPGYNIINGRVYHGFCSGQLIDICCGKPLSLAVFA